MDALIAASRAYVKPKDFKPSYGTAGFRAVAALLPSTMFRCGQSGACSCKRARSAEPGGTIGAVAGAGAGSCWQCGR